MHPPSENPTTPYGPAGGIVGAAQSVEATLNGLRADVSAAVTEAIGDLVDQVVAVKPRLRGWLHATLAPIALGLGTAFAIAASGTVATLGTLVFTVAALLLFGVSGVYHTRTWSPRMHTFWRKFDHANIFVMIAGSYTPFALLLLDGTIRTVMLASVWGGALAGAGFRLLWTDAPRWLYVSCYLALGWAAVFAADDMTAATSPAIIALLGAGGLLYSLGAVVYGLQRPDPFPAWFGFHEVFHTCTALAFTCHVIALGLLVL